MKQYFLPYFLPFILALVSYFVFIKVPKYDHLTRFENDMRRLKLSQGRILSLWALSNILAGCSFTFIADIPHIYYHTMNACWGIVNLGIAAFIFYHHNQVFDHPQPILKQMDYQRHAEKMQLFNIGLDIAFIAIGCALYNLEGRSLPNFPGLWAKFGISVMVQGSFLLVQDNFFYFLHVRNRHQVYPSWERKMKQIN